MPSRTEIEDFLAQDTLAVVGVSRDPQDFSHAVWKRLAETGHTLYAVNPAAEAVEGEPCYRSLQDLPGPVGGVVVMVPPGAATSVVQDAIDAGIPRVWLHRGSGQGSVTPEAVSLCRAAHVPVVDGACPMMFLEPVGGVHRLHRFFVRRSLN